MYKLIFILILYVFAIFNAYSQEINCNPDSTKRTRITTENIPNSYSCYMEMKRGWSTYYGSGALIHPRVIITAGHNLAYFPFVKRLPFFLFRGTRKIDLYFGSIDSHHYKTNTSIKLKRGKTKFFNSWYWANSDISRDFSIIILPDSSIYKQVGGCYKFSPLTANDLNGSSVHITGSPGDKDLYEMWTDSTTNFSVSNSSINYDLYTAVRNSGSPIWTKTNNSVQLVGVHSRGFNSCNGSVFIDQKTYKQVVEWCKQAGINLQ